MKWFSSNYFNLFLSKTRCDYIFVFPINRLRIFLLTMKFKSLQNKCHKTLTGDWTRLKYCNDNYMVKYGWFIQKKIYNSNRLIVMITFNGKHVLELLQPVYGFKTIYIIRYIQFTFMFFYFFHVKFIVFFAIQTNQNSKADGKNPEKNRWTWIKLSLSLKCGQSNVINFVPSVKITYESWATTLH